MQEMHYKLREVRILITSRHGGHDGRKEKHTRKLYNDDISKLTGKIRYQNRMFDIEYHY